MTHKKERTKRIKKPWPTKAAMEQVYALHLWGGQSAAFYSGEGSHHPELVTPYIEAVTVFLKSFKHPLVVCDLGCGDFNIGKQLLKHTKKYVAVDIVKDLIAHNQEHFKADHLEFQCLDIAVDILPSGDCAILRQVLQHLSNSEIQSILQKLTAYKYVMITEHLPEGHFVPNADIISGQGTRLKKQSGLDLLAAPFHFKPKEQNQLLSIRLKDGEGRIVTTVYKMP